MQVAAVNPSGTGPYSTPVDFNFTSEWQVSMHLVCITAEQSVQGL